MGVKKQLIMTSELLTRSDVITLMLCMKMEKVLLDQGQLLLFCQCTTDCTIVRGYTGLQKSVSVCRAVHEEM